jgi:hypothetical protein
LFVDVGIDISLVVLLVDSNAVETPEVEIDLILTADQNFGMDILENPVQPLPDKS